MTNEERDFISQFIARVGGGAPASGGFSAVPSTQPSAQLPPIDPEADAFIADQFTRHPEARYRITQLAFVQEHALVAAQARINDLQSALNQARQSSASGQQSPWGQGGAQPQPPQSRGFLSGLFGGGNAPPPASRPQQYAPQPQQYAPPPQYAGGMPPMMAQQSGNGFLGGALRTAAGVAGGMVAGEALMSLFSGGHGGGLGGFGSGVSSPTTIIEEGSSGAGPWGSPAGGTDQFDQGGALKDDAGGDKFADGGAVDNSAWTTPDQGGGWTDASNVSDSGGGGWDDTSGSGSDSV